VRASAVGRTLVVARRRGLTIARLDLRNSGDTAGLRDRVVGYGSWVLFEPAEELAGASRPWRRSDPQ
jgi:MEMO1 family protein